MKHKRKTPTPKAVGSSDLVRIMETPTQTARRLCGNWMHPTGDAHYRDVKTEIKKLHAERLLLAKIAAETPQFYNPFHCAEAIKLRDEILANAGTERSGGQRHSTNTQTKKEPNV
jgi:hypothetical protein